MSSIIKQIKEKIKFFLNQILDFFSDDIVFYSLLIIFASSTSFLLGSFSEFHKQKQEEISKIQILKDENAKKIFYVASKNGKRYYLPWCYFGSEKNKIRFETKEAAEEAGYTASKSCEGL